MTLENGVPVSSFEFTCYILNLAQRSLSSKQVPPQPNPQIDNSVPMDISQIKPVQIPPPVEKKREIKVEKRKRIDRYGQLVLDRRVNYEPIRYSYEPDWNLTPLPLHASLKEGKLLSRSLSRGILRIFIIKRK